MKQAEGGAKAELDFDLKDIDADLESAAKNGVTRFSLRGQKFSNDKRALAEFLKKAARWIPDAYISIPVSAQALDAEIAALLQNLFCSLDIFMRGEAGQKFFLDKKLFSKKAALLNGAGIVFGFLMDYARADGDSVKNFRERLDFALTLYPNHVDFDQLFSPQKEARNTATFSSQDINWARGVAFAVRVFYTEGRAVPWFNSVLKPLKIAPSKFFSDFAEWQRCNNAGWDARQKILSLGHKEIEKMQVLFLEEKYSEKRLEHLIPAVTDIVRINGAYSRLEGEGEESELALSYNPDDLTSPAAFDIAAFCDNVCMEECRAKIYDAGGEMACKIL